MPTINLVENRRNGLYTRRHTPYTSLDGVCSLISETNEYEPAISYRFTRNRTWTNTTDFETKLRLGTTLPTNTYTDYQLREHFPKVNMRFIHPVCGISDERSGPGYANHFVTTSLLDFSSYALSQAKLDCLNRASNMKFNAAVAFKEARKTSDFIYDVCNRLIGAFRAVKKFRYKEAASLLKMRDHPKVIYGKGLSETWLQYRYGAMPLLQDAKSAAESIADMLINRMPTLRVSATVKTSKLDDRSGTRGVIAYADSGNRSLGNCSLSAKHVIEQSCRAGLVIRPQLDLSRGAGTLGLDDPLSIIWELTFLSFLADWVFQVGDFLKAHSALNGVDVLSGYTAQLATVDTKCVISNISSSDNAAEFSSGTGGEMHVQGRRFQRSPWSGNPPDYRLPIEDDALNLKRIFDAAALMRVLLVNDPKWIARPSRR